MRKIFFSLVAMALLSFNVSAADADKEATIRDRLATYHEQTSASVGFYQDKAKEGADAPNYDKFDGTQGIDDVKQQILSALKG